MSQDEWFQVTKWLDSESDCEFARPLLEDGGIECEIRPEDGKFALFRYPPPVQYDTKGYAKKEPQSEGIGVQGLKGKAG